MKKLFTLIAAALCALNISAQTTITSSDEGDMLSFAGVTAPDSYDGVVFKNPSGSLTLTLTDTNGKFGFADNTQRFGTAESYKKVTGQLKTGGKSSSKNNMKLTVTKAGTLYVYVRSANKKAEDRNLVLTQDGRELYNKVIQDADAVSATETSDEGTSTVSIYPVASANVTAGDVDITYPKGALNFYGFEIVAPSTGITGIATAQKVKSDARYNLAGQRVGKEYKGIVIENGKKMIVK